MSQRILEVTATTPRLRGAYGTSQLHVWLEINPLRLDKLLDHLGRERFLCLVMAG